LGFLYHGYAFSIIDRARGYLLGKGQIQRREEPLHLKRDQNPSLSGILTAPPKVLFYTRHYESIKNCN